jgi:hypothetical protein
MAPPKKVMGAVLGEDDPPTQLPRAGGQQPAQRVEQLGPNDWAVPSGEPSTGRKDSPPGGIKLEVGRHRVTVSQLALVAVLTALGGWFGKDAVSKGEQVELGDVLTELRAVRKDVRDLKGDVGDVRDDQRKARSSDTKILNYVEDSLAPVFASLGKLGVKFQFAGRQPEPIEFHPAPMQGSNAAPIQPKAVLPERPSL